MLVLNRITSYNVCYTKLLREGFNLLEEPIPLDANGMPVDDSIKYQIYRLAERGAEMVYVGVDAFSYNFV